MMRSSPESEETIPRPQGKGLFARFLRRQDGAAAIEFALVAAPTIALILAILQVSIIYFAQEELETAVEQSARQVLTNQAPAAGTTTTSQQAALATFATTVCNNLPALFVCPSGVMINLNPVASFANANVPTPVLTYNPDGTVSNQWTYNPGGPGDIMIMQVMYQWPVFLGPLNFTLANLPNNKRLMMATAVFRNEP
jgi:Flp pilus assembly protein TadG